MINYKKLLLKIVISLITIATGVYLQKFQQLFIIISILGILYGLGIMFNFLATTNGGMYQIDTTTEKGKEQVKNNKLKIILFLILQIMILLTVKCLK